MIVSHNEKRVNYKNMTSSNCIEKLERQKMRKTRTNRNTFDNDNQQIQDYKPLTNFSIESIIGNVVEKSSSDTNYSSTEQLDKRKERKLYNDNHIETFHKKKIRPKNFQCPACKMAFSNNGQLKNHVRIHTGERPFRCNHSDCNKTFTRNEELTRHKLIHTGVRPHSCSSCGKQFGRKDHLKKHIRTHERKTKYKSRKQAFTPNQSFPANSKCVKDSKQNKIDNNDFLVVPSKLLRNQEEASFFPANCYPPPPTTTANKSLISHHQLSQQGIVTLPVTSRAGQHLVPTVISQSSSGSHHLHHQNSIQKQLIGQEPLPLQFFNPTMFATTTTTTNAIQHLANDYWHKWYNLIGLCQQQQHGITQSPEKAQMSPSAQLELFQRKLS